MKLRFHPGARVEYVEALAHLEERRLGYGEKFETEVFAALQRALDFPGSGAQVPGYPEQVNLRAFPLRVFRYSLMIHFDGDEAVVYAVAHQHREPGYWRDRLK
ncbi:type II toxin-antitoxin system RelE/ParE family toxin [Pseudenhygromyxa sp. WMMC2535]|uniref:type II toxin-antitoxin system RelE/ParE family toxin n=1 Tax=Pseudenhygromyxa sp. WMMC2535 TaxID=2712867 RepID=UPI001552C8AD|nr:type II toxin-antitoxin system RelE/ParE family toxin [Pseudenhygromyxa sp. WMMC2535]NVB41810.1 type II toxin-antitoxin system RelE/ParE family toxin [Pseudenhygromyxa sp. WMMC2535]